MCDTKMFQGIAFSEIKGALFRDCSHLSSSKYLHDISSTNIWYFIYNKLNCFSPQKLTTKNRKKSKTFQVSISTKRTKTSDQLFR